MKFAIIISYIVVLLLVGWISMKKTKTLNDFFLGGRNIGPWLSAFAYGTTYFSAVVFIGYAGKTGWGFGLSGLWIVVGNAVLGSFLAWRVLAKPTRAMSIRIGSITMPGFFARRYNSVGMEIFAAVIIFIFLVPYCSSVYSGLSYLIEMVFDINYEYALMVMAVVTAVYLVMGGYTAMSRTDLFQGMIMIVGVLVMIGFVVKAPEVGGFANVIPKLKAIDPGLVAPVGPGGPIALFSMVILTSLGPWAMPQMVQRFYSIKSEAVIKAASWVTLFVAIIIAFGAYFTGSLTHLFFSDLSAVNGNVDLLMPTILKQTLPEAMLAIILVLVLAASMSTLASLVLVSSSSVAINIVDTLFPRINDRKMMLMMRCLCIVFVIVSLISALKPGVILNVMSLSWGAIAGSFLAPYLFGLFYRKTTKAGAWAGMITGLSIALIFSSLFPTQTPIVGCVAMIVPLFVVPLVSAFTKPFSPEFVKSVFEGVGNGEEGKHTYIWEGLKKSKA